MQIQLDKIIYTFSIGILFLLTITILSYYSYKIYKLFQNGKDVDNLFVFFKKKLKSIKDGAFISFLFLGLSFSLGMIVEIVSDGMFGHQVLDDKVKVDSYKRFYDPSCLENKLTEESYLYTAYHPYKDNLPSDILKEYESVIKKGFYYAKNIVYSKPTYFEELNKIEDTICFLKTFELLIVFILIWFPPLILAYFFFIFKESPPLNFVKRIFKRKKTNITNSCLNAEINKSTFLTNRKNIIPHLIVFLLLFFSLFIIELFAIPSLISIQEKEFDNRVWGYFQDNDRDREGCLVNIDKDIMSKTYSILASSRRFEPSSIITIDASNYFIFSDKDASSYIYKYRHVNNDFVLIDSLFIKFPLNKIESSTAIRDDNNHIKQLFLCTSFSIIEGDSIDKDNNRILLLIDFKKDTVVKCNLYSPEKFIKEKFDKNWIQVEALCVIDNFMYIGIRAIGDHYNHPEYQVLILRYSLSNLENKPEIHCNFKTEFLQRDEGISSLEKIGKNVIMITSYESHKRHYDKRLEVGSHIWIIPEKKFLNKKIELKKLWEEEKFYYYPNKAEAVDYFNGHPSNLIIFFDDDNLRKNNTDSIQQGLFNIKTNEAYYHILKIEK